MAKKKNDTNETPPSPEEERIQYADISSEMEDSYINYAMSVITARALPDVRDGMKPVQRRILYAAHEEGLNAQARFRKSANLVGTVLGRYHPHGDSSVYEAMVKMAQPFTYRYPLIMSQGNFGSIDGDPPAAMRYTEAKLSRLAGEMLRDLEKETVEWRQNYDGTRKEPEVLPAAAPNFILNGTLGIAVGMATNVPPHNLNEIIDACAHLIETEDPTTEDLLQFVKGPDFPTGGLVYGENDLHHAYASGRGGVTTRGVAEIVEEKGKHQIVITEIPYRVNKADLVVQIADLVRDKKVEGVKNLRDESTSDIRVVIDLKAGAHPQKVLNHLYKHTDLEQTYHFNLVALVDGTPQTLSLKRILGEFVTHRKNVVTRRAQHDLRKAEERAHILEGLKKALDDIDAVIQTIKKSRDTRTAHRNLMKQFNFTDVQATAILEMRLQKLAGLERKAIEEELKEKKALIKELKALLASEQKLYGVVKDELLEVKKKYGDERRTKVVAQSAQNISAEDMIPDEDSVLVYTKGGYVKRTNPGEYRKQKRGGVGVMDLNTKEEDFITHFLNATTHSDLLFFSDKGKVYQMKMYDIPEGKRATKGKSIMNFLALSSQEAVSSILAVPKEVKQKKALSLFMVTKYGMAKKVAAENFHDVRRSGIMAFRLARGDELFAARFVEEGDSVVLASAQGQAIRFSEDEVREMGRSAGGVRVFKLSDDDHLVGADVIKKGARNQRVLAMSANGYGKQTPASEYKVQKRGGSGVKTAQLTQKTGDLVGTQVISDEYQELVAISKKGQVIRVDLDSIPELGRQTQGVRIMKPRAGDNIASLIAL